MSDTIAARREALGTVHDVIRALRATSAGRIQAALRALRSARVYEDAVAKAIADLLAESDASQAPPPARGAERGQAGLVVILSEQSLAGSLDHDVLALADRRIAQLRRDGAFRLLVVGRHGQKALAPRREIPHEAQPGATSVDGLPGVARRMARWLGACVASGDIRSLDVVYPRFESLGRQIPAETRIFPAEPLPVRSGGPSGRRFYRYLPVQDLLDGLVSELAFIRLYRISAEAFASEQAARLAATDAAARSAERRLESLRALEMQVRREAVTRQILELIAARLAHG